ncbi:phosphoenolpyruvate synthase [Cecembia lonarensis]|uniref:Phosphoenolpyruvate synthase n=1 Tax=Cecembia lonarensis (strain CCUG 58316 / KCTC 22772 / LW9) TaxID=1225176 RepID=K1KW84_CECL9|nr:phosphoenolpyruvate synthase [Cecembia lonarensis]EKB48425.1 Phosphoenolpyruvate synthase [Cecembia lonarensis LW9]
MSLNLKIKPIATITTMSTFIIPFRQIRNKDIAKVGGKNASLGEMISELGALGVRIPDGFATTAEAFRMFLEENRLKDALGDCLAQLQTDDMGNLSEVGSQCRALMSGGVFNEAMQRDFLEGYRTLGQGQVIAVAVRSSATAEDLPTASFAGQHDSFLNIEGEKELLAAIHQCYISLFNDRAIKYRVDNGFDHMEVALSVGVQKMVRADLGSAGVAFTIDPETGFENAIYITSAWGLGENVVQGAVNPDEFYAFKPAIEKGKKSLIFKKMGAKEHKMVYAIGGERPVKNIKTSALERQSYSLEPEEVELLADWCYKIEKHYGMPMDVEWAKDGLSGELFIVQARPETVHGEKDGIKVKEYSIKGNGKVLVKGKAVGNAITSGRVCIVKSLADAGKVQHGDIIVADITNPDWNAMLKKAVSIVTNKGGRTSHASIVARELGIHAIVGTGNATDKLQDGQIITVSCAEGDEGIVYEGKLDWEVKELDFQALAPTRTKPMFILADPFRAFRLSFYPNEGVGLLRMEFIISNTIRIHPMALVKYDGLPENNDKKAITAITQNYPDKRQYFTEKLSEHIAMVAAAFYPKDVIVRMSDFKTNEYAQLIGGKGFEPQEENPMLGFRGASRYYHELYREGFGLECEAMKIIRDDFGLDNVKLMIPFCRTVEEGRKVLETMKSFGLERGKNGLEVYVMAELPSNVILADEYAEIFDGFSIGSNDLTQLTLGIDRDSEIVSDLFDENNGAVKSMLAQVIRKAKKANRKIGLCGQAPSDYPEFAQFLVEEGIDSISFNPDALLRGIENISKAEKIDQNPK